MMFRLFMPNPSSINRLIELFQHQENAGLPTDAEFIEDNEILTLLVATRDFLTNTSTDFQKQRDMWINDATIQEIFAKIALAFNSFNKNPLTQKKSMALEFCIQTINDQLTQLHKNHDKIFTFYAQKNPLLNRIINEYAASKNKIALR